MRFRLRMAFVLALAATALLACRPDEPKVDTAAQEAQLRERLTNIRGAIRAFREENGRYPYTLEELVPKHLPAIPTDPLTGSATTWKITTEETVEPNSDFTAATSTAPRSVIVDVQSGAGEPWSSW